LDEIRTYSYKGKKEEEKRRLRRKEIAVKKDPAEH